MTSDEALVAAPDGRFDKWLSLLCQCCSCLRGIFAAFCMWIRCKSLACFALQNVLCDITFFFYHDGMKKYIYEKINTWNKLDFFFFLRDFY